MSYGYYVTAWIIIVFVTFGLLWTYTRAQEATSSTQTIGGVRGSFDTELLPELLKEQRKTSRLLEQIRKEI